jgi:phenylacetate-coenzyme A ligase PaaK-like adenylate-forming protein
VRIKSGTDVKIMYVFGNHEQEFKLNSNLDFILDEAKTRRRESSQNSIHLIIEVLAKLEDVWCRDGKYYKSALEELSKQSSFSQEMDKATLDIIPSLFNKDNLKKRVFVEFKNLDTLDSYTHLEHYDGEIKYNPLGVLLHVTAGNVFLGCIDSLLMGILTKNVSLVKLSSSNIYLPYLFIKSLEEIDHEKLLCNNICLLNWKGGDKEIESKLKSGVDGIITWGGEEMATSYQKDLPLGVKLIQHGPKISFHVLSATAVATANSSFYDSIVVDIIMWDQSACANSQNIFIEDGVDVDLFNNNLNCAFLRNNIERGKLSSDEATEILKDFQLATYEEFLSGHKVFKNNDYMISFEKGCSLSPTALNRTIKVKSFESIEKLSSILGEFRMYLQTCGLSSSSSEQKQYIELLSLAGVTRFTAIGEMLSGNIGSPHDGAFSLTELVNVHCLESSSSIENFALDMVRKIPFYKDKLINSFKDIPIIDGTTLSENSIHCSDMMIDIENKSPGKVFSTGGTTGAPKYCLYTDNEFQKTSKLLGESYIKLGLKHTDRVINLFMAGNMWSSFSAIQYSLEYAGVRQFPMGGLASVDDIAKLISSFNINVIFGLPSTILNLLNAHPNLEIEKIFYAGEFLSKVAQVKLNDKWKCNKIYSAGYATVDVGPIGYQTLGSKGSEHVLFNDLIHLEVINGEAIVTSKVRKAMPILRYRTGDKVRVLEQNSQYTKFELLGRIDERINIWSCRIEKNEIDLALKSSFGINPDFQIVIDEVVDSDRIYDKLEIRLANTSLPKELEDLYLVMYQNCMDVNKTISLETLKNHLIFSEKPFISNVKTGKQKAIFDRR